MTNKLNGLFCINKPVGMTSFDVVAILRKKLGIKRIGHSGTLDPNASGLMLMLVGQSTKLLPFIVHQTKTYQASLQFGIKTSTADIWGEIIEKSDVIEISQEKVDEILNSFIGKQKQIPPMVSAISVNGKRLYEYARKGIEIDRVARDIEIFSITGHLIDKGISFDVHCSSGTYVRVLCEDIALRCGMLGTLSSLKRVQIENLDLNHACDLEEIEYDTIQWLNPKDLIHYPMFETSMIDKVYQGKRLELNTQDDRVGITHKGQLMAIYEYDTVQNNYRSIRGLW